MKLTTTDANYCATVVKIDKLFPLENCDNLMGFSVFGYTAIVSKDTKPWTIGVVFTAETQLSDEYCKANNMYREPTLNKDVTQKWYIENNRRVRAMKLRWNVSSALFMPIQSLINVWAISSEDVLFVGDTFNEIDGKYICFKYIVPTKQFSQGNHTKGKTKQFVKIDNKTFPEHRDTENYFRNCSKYIPWDTITVSQKLHWSNGRFGYVKCKKKLNRIHRIAKAIGISVDPTECVLRDAWRVNPVGAKTIWTMYNKYLRPNAEPLFKSLAFNKKLKSCIICDIDGTLALHDRWPYEFEKLDTDILNIPVEFIIATAYENVSVILMSGRSEEYRKPTEKRLRKHKISYSALYMRPANDTREDTKIKRELYETHIQGKYNVLFAIDDRTRIVDQRREMWIYTLDVNQTREVF